MSYILDALRRADSERERGRVPGLHAQPGSGVSDDDDAADGGGMRWGFVAAVLGLALIVMLAWLAFGREKPIEVAMVPPPAAPAMPVAAPVVAAPPVAPPPAAAPDPVPAPAPAPRAEAPAEAPPARPQRKTPPVKREAARASAPVATEDDSRVFTVSELPDDVRRALPALAISGATYSESRANRMLIVNGQLFHEGDVVAPNLHLEQIRLKSAVLRFKNYRYTVGY